MLPFTRMKRPNDFDGQAALILGGALGASLMFLLDPERGRRRRAGVRDRVVHGMHVGTHAADVTGRDLAHRAEGVAARFRSRFVHEEVDDAILVDRVRSKMGRYVTHPHSVHVTVRNGEVTLEGVVLARERKRLLRAVAKVPGVRAICDCLEAHRQDERVPGLQGSGRKPGRRIDFLQAHWAPSTRAFALAGGASAVLLGVRRRDLLGFAFLSAGAALVLRGLTNLELRRVFGLGRGRPLEIRKIVNIAAPVQDVFDFWLNFQNFPRFLKGVRSVQARRGGRSHWEVEGPGGLPVRWDAELTRQLRHELIAWRSIPGSIVRHAGRVRFRRTEEGGTRVELEFSFTLPAAGAPGAFLVRRRLNDALAQIKTMLEHGPSQRQVAGFH